MYKKILVATDGSDYSNRAMKAAVELAKIHGASIEMLHIIPTQTAVYPFPPVSQEDVQKIKDKVKEETLKGIDAGGVTITSNTLTGSPAAGILSYCAADYDLIVMGTKGHGAIGGALIGSVTQRILAEAKCPVLVIK